MKKLLTLSFLLCLLLAGKTQTKKNLVGDFTPFYLNSEFENRINKKNIKVHMLPAYDNDSLIKAHGADKERPGGSWTCGIPIKTDINLRKDARGFYLPDGIVWIYIIESPTADHLGVHFKSLKLPDGAKIIYYPGIEPETIWSPDVYTKKDNDFMSREVGFGASSRNRKMIIEYYEPHNASFIPEIIIQSISHGWDRPIKKK